MGILQAVLSLLALVTVFIADRRIKSICKKNLDRTEPVTEAIVDHNLTTVALRNERLANLALLAFAATLIIQILSAFNAAYNQNQTNMSEIHEIVSRVTKIERYIWGDGGGIAKPPAPTPPDLGQRLEAIEKKLGETQTVTNADANLARINRIIIGIKAEIEELKKEQVKAATVPARTRAHAH